MKSWLPWSVSLGCAVLIGAVGLMALPRPIDTRTKIVTVSGIPASISSASMSSDLGRGVTTIHYMIQNDSKESLDAFRAFALVQDEFGHTRGGESWVKHSTIAPNDSESFSVPLRNVMDPSDHVVLILTAAYRHGQGWEVSKGTRVNALVSGQAAASAHPEDCPPNFCTDAQENAREACPNGIHQFSCSQNTCSYSYTCNP